MKKILMVLLAVFVCAICLAGCASKKEEEPEIPENDAAIFGTWMEDYWDSGYAFREDGTGSDIFWNQEFTYTALEGKLSISYTEGLWAEKDFAYTIAGDILTLTEILPEGSAEAPGTWDYKKQP